MMLSLSQQCGLPATMMLSLSQQCGLPATMMPPFLKILFTMTIFTFLGLVVLIALLSAFLILLISKIGVRDNIISRSPKLVSKLFACDFCLSFWTACILIAILSLVVIVIDLASHPGNCIYAIPFFSTPITRILI